MKTPLFFIAALAAFFTLPVDFTIMASALFAAGLMAIVVADYRRNYRPAYLPRSAVAYAAPREHFRLAA